MSRPITSNVIESILKKKKKTLPTNKNPGPDGFTGEFYHMFREHLASVLLKLFQKTAEESLLWGQYYPDTKTRQRYHKKKHKIKSQYHWWI